jgi:hypothetical protein
MKENSEGSHGLHQGSFKLQTMTALIKSFCRGVQGGQFFQKAPPLVIAWKWSTCFLKKFPGSSRSSSLYLISGLPYKETVPSDCTFKPRGRELAVEAGSFGGIPVCWRL